MIKAGALNYTIFLAVITAVLCMLMISLAWHGRSYFIRMDWHEKVKDNASSGIVLGMTLNDSQDFREWVDLYGEQSDSVHIFKRLWGLYEMVAAQAQMKGSLYKQTAFVAHHSSELEKTALWLSDRNRPLQLCGNALLQGECFLPAKGVDRAYIEGTNYKRTKMVYGIQQQSKNRLPEIPAIYDTYWQPYLNGIFSEVDSVADFAEAPQKLRHSFQKKTLVYTSKDPVTLGNFNFQGNIIVHSKAKIIVEATSHLEHVLLIAPYIEFQSGFRGLIQVVSSDTITVDSEVMLSYPSSLLLLGSDQERPPYLSIGDDCIIRGSVVNLWVAKNRTNDISVQMDKGSTLEGLLYCEGNLQLNGTVKGPVLCNNFLLKTPSGVYENHLLDGQIDRTGLHAGFSGPQISDWKSNKETVAWLYY